MAVLRRNALIGRALSECRRMAGQTQFDLALQLGCTQPRIARIECGRFSHPRLDTLRRIFDVLGTEVVTRGVIGALWLDVADWREVVGVEWKQDPGKVLLFVDLGRGLPAELRALLDGTFESNLVVMAAWRARILFDRERSLTSEGFSGTFDQ